MPLLVENAEDFNLENLKEIIIPVNFSFIESLEQYLLSNVKIPISLLGPKGSGKTFAVMKALEGAVKKDKKLLPVVFTHKQGKSSILDPLKLASSETWGERYFVYKSCCSREDLLNEANIIVEDDIHYRCEAIVKGREDPKVLVSDLKRDLEEVEHGKKLIIVSEDLLSAYAKEMNIEELDEILLKLGEVPLDDEKYLKYKDKRSYLAHREISPLSYKEWSQLFRIYNVEADKLVADILYSCSPSPRAFIKFFKLFQPQKAITIDDLIAKTREMLPKKVKEIREFEVYKSLLSLPLIETGAKLEEMKKALSYPEKMLEEIYKFLPLIKKLCQNAAGRLLLEDDPAYVLRIKKKEDPIEVIRAVRNAIEISGISEEEQDKVAELVHIYYSDYILSKIEKIYPIIQTLKNIFPFQQRKRYFGIMKRNLHEYYMERDYGWVLTRPFHLVLQDILYERPSLDVVLEGLSRKHLLRL